jgi:hypothetical protein
VVVRAFSKAELDALPGTVCRRETADEGNPRHEPENDAGPSEQSWSDALCSTMTACSQCTCGECWVLLGCIRLKDDDGIVGEPDVAGRRWVKPIEALCATVVDRIKQLEEKVDSLTQPSSPQSPQSPHSPSSP